MKTCFGFNAQRFRYHGLVLLLITTLPVFFEGVVEVQKHSIFYICLIIISIVVLITYLWLYPLIYIEENGILVKRMFFLKKQINWGKIDFQIKTRKSKNKLISLNYKIFNIDPRYGVLKIKNTNIFNRYIFLTSQMENFDLFINCLKNKLAKCEVPQ